MSPFKWKLLSSTFLWYCLLCCTRWFQLLSLRMKSWSVTIQMKATEQYLPVVLFIILYKVVLTFEAVDEVLKCDHSNECYWAVLSWGNVYYAVQGGANLRVCRWNSKVWPFKWKLLSGTFLWCCLLCWARWFYKLLSIFKWAIHIKARDKSDPSRAILALMLLSRSYLKVRRFSLSSVLIDDKDNEHSTANQNSNGTFYYGYTNRTLYNGAIQFRIDWFSNRTGTSFVRRERARKGLNSTAGAQFAAQPLVKPVVWFARAVVNWSFRSVAKSA